MIVCALLVLAAQGSATRRPVVGIAVASLFVGESAFAGACQVLSSTWNVQLHCGLPSRGYGRGFTYGGLKFLEANSTGVSGPLSEVGAVAVNSSGALLPACKPIDTTENNISVVIGGDPCAAGVKFWVQVGY